MNWWTSEGNYARFRGGGIKKKQIAKQLSQGIKNVSKVERTAHSVLAKIRGIEASFRKAHDWANETGQGVLETDPPGFDRAVLLRCKYYFQILDIMQDRASSKALMSSEDLYPSSDQISDTDEEPKDDKKDEENNNNEDVSSVASSLTGSSQGSVHVVNPPDQETSKLKQNQKNKEKKTRRKKSIVRKRQTEEVDVLNMAKDSFNITKWAKTNDNKVRAEVRRHNEATGTSSDKNA